jgi:Flp pilus assembly protein protease CpaA
MNLFDPILIAIIIFGIATSYTDIKKGKIKNLHITLLLLSGFFINVLFTKTLVGYSLDINSDFIQTITNVSITFLLGFFIWSANMWSAGDAKLFLGYSLLLPIFTYKYGYAFLFPSLAIFINTIVPLAFFLILSSLFRLRLKYFKDYVKKNFRVSDLANTILFIFGSFYILQLILFQFNIQLNFILQVIILFALMEFLNKISHQTSMIFSIVGSILRLILSFSSILTFSFFWEMTSMLLIFVGLRLLIFYIFEFSFVELVKIKNLKPGMLLDERLIKTKKGYEKMEHSLFTIFDILKHMKEGFLTENSMTLTAKDIEKLKKDKKLKFDTIKIAKTIPFAPFMFFGVLLTYFLQGSLFYYLILAIDVLSKFFV